MDENRMLERDIKFSKRQFSILHKYSLVFNKKSKDGFFSYANIEPKNESSVEGILYDIEEGELIKLDRFEGFPNHYNKIYINVIDINGYAHQAITYIANPAKIVEGLNPKSEYLLHLIKGSDILSQSYREKLLKIIPEN